MKTPVLSTLLFASCFLVVGCGKKDAASVSNGGFSKFKDSFKKEFRDAAMKSEPRTDGIVVLKDKFRLGESEYTTMIDMPTVSDVKKSDGVEFPYDIPVSITYRYVIEKGGSTTFAPPLGEPSLKGHLVFHVGENFTISDQFTSVGGADSGTQQNIFAIVKKTCDVVRGCQ